LPRTKSTARLLAVGDIHLGRRPSRVPGDLDTRPLTPAAAWRRTVDKAIALQVDAVVLAGDVIESPKDRFEAYPVLEAGVTALLEAQIRVLGVAGNHDVDALPRLASRIEGFHLLGAGGVWEAVDVAGVRVLGWSFPTQVVRHDPLDSPEPARLAADARGAVIGLLHCDRDQSGSPYAPTTSARIDAAPGDAWLLGHIHRPDALHRHPRGYLGCLSGMDPGEPGARGPWLITVAGAGDVTAEQLPLAPIRYEHVELNVEALGASEAVGEELADVAGDALRDALDAHHALIFTEGLHAVAARVLLTGRVLRRSEVIDAFLAAKPSARQQRDGVEWFVEAIKDRTRSAADLGRLAVGRHPAAALARQILALQSTEDAEGDRLVREGGAKLRQAASVGAWRDIEPADLSDEAVRAQLLQAGYDALEALEASKAP
jgi:predicted phosphodiesterase